MKTLSLADQACLNVDRFLKTVFGRSTAHRPYPAQGLPAVDLDDSAAKHAAGLMRVNHAGEVCAQALYQGQALTARLDQVSEKMQQAAEEEVDHLAWCEARLAELNSQPSYLNLFWYAGAFGLGALAGLIGDRWSLGFVAETERQVVAHLESHLEKLPIQDARSAAIIQQMREDEDRHREMALDAGGYILPRPIQGAMRLSSKLMTTLAYYL